MHLPTFFLSSPEGTDLFWYVYASTVEEKFEILETEEIECKKWFV
jgi:hypothetical protein